MPVAAGVADVKELDLLESGVHPVSVQVRRNGALVASHTTLVDVIRADGPGRGPFTFFALAAIDDAGPFPDDAELAAAGVEIERATALASTMEEPITVAIPPTYLMDGDDASDELVAALDGNDRLLVVADQPLDPSSAVASELNAELARGVSGGERALASRFAATPVVRSGWVRARQHHHRWRRPRCAICSIPLLVVPFDKYLDFPNDLGDITIRR